MEKMELMSVTQITSLQPANRARILAARQAVIEGEITAEELADLELRGGEAPTIKEKE